MLNHSGCPWYYINIFSYLIGLLVYWLMAGRTQYQKAIDLDVEKRLQLRLSQQQTPKPSSQQTPKLSSQQTTAIIKHLESKLAQLLQGDRAAAMRLVQGVKSKNPNKSVQLCWEKAIEDLERDRI